MFVDASALCAILLSEEDGLAYAAKIRDADAPMTSALAVFETVAAVARVASGGVAAARTDVADLLRAARIRMLAIGDAERERRGQLVDGGLPSPQARQNGPPRGVGQGAEDVVEGGGGHTL